MRKRNLLIDEYPLLVLPSLAKTIGLNEAIALQQLHYWLENPKGGIEHEGERWVYNTYEQWQKDNFPFWSIRTIQRVFLNLENDGLIVSKQLAAYDRKKYYRIHYDKLASWKATDCPPRARQGDVMDDDKEAHSLNESETTAERNPDIDNNPTFQILHQAAISIWPKDPAPFREFKKELRDAQFERINGTIRIYGIGQIRAAAFQNRYSRVFEDALLPVLNKEIKVVFQP